MTDEVSFALLLLRVVLGVTMALHGLGKAKSLDGTAGWFDSMGMRPGWLHARFAAFGEIAAGAALALGFLTSFAALGFVGLMVVAGWTSHRHNGFFIIKEGWEYVMVLAVAAVAIAIIGPGDWSIDEAIGLADGLDGWVGLAISAGGGVIAGVGLMAAFYRPPPTSTA
ncbi:MAG: DoxX family protein [Actinomycetota bacterium]